MLSARLVAGFYIIWITWKVGVHLQMNVGSCTCPKLQTMRTWFADVFTRLYSRIMWEVWRYICRWTLVWLIIILYVFETVDYGGRKFPRSFTWNRRVLFEAVRTYPCQDSSKDIRLWETLRLDGTIRTFVCTDKTKATAFPNACSQKQYSVCIVYTDNFTSPFVCAWPLDISSNRIFVCTK